MYVLSAPPHPVCHYPYPVQQWDPYESQIAPRLTLFIRTLIHVIQGTQGRAMEVIIHITRIITRKCILSVVLCQTITWTIADLSAIGLSATKFCGILINMRTYSFKKTFCMWEDCVQFVPTSTWLQMWLSYSQTAILHICFTQWPLWDVTTILTLKGPVPYIYNQPVRLTAAPLICAALEPSLSRTPHAVGPHLSRGFVPSRADASRGSIEKSVNRGFARSRKPRFPSECRGYKRLGRDTQAVNLASIHLCPIAHI